MVAATVSDSGAGATGRTGSSGSTGSRQRLGQLGRRLPVLRPAADGPASTERTRLTSRTTSLAATLIACSLALAACGSSSSGSSRRQPRRGAGCTRRPEPGQARGLPQTARRHASRPPRRLSSRGAGGLRRPAGRRRQSGRRPAPDRPPAARTRRRLAARTRSSGPRFTACGGFRGGGFGGPPAAPRRASIQRFVACVSKHGYKLPDARTSRGSGPVFPARIQTNAKFQAASRACQSILLPTQPGAAKLTAREGEADLAPRPQHSV